MFILPKQESFRARADSRTAIANQHQKLLDFYINVNWTYQQFGFLKKKLLKCISYSGDLKDHFMLN